jgi:Cys-rich protein (TIGR01571 family)
MDQRIMWKYWKWNKYMVIMTVGVLIFSGEHFYLVYYYRCWNMNFSKRLILSFLYIYDQYMCWDWKICILFGFKRRFELQTPSVCENKHLQSLSISGLAYFVPILNIITWLGIRGKIREMKGIEGSTVNDCLAILCCPFCALIQEAQEVQGGGPSAQSMSRE